MTLRLGLTILAVVIIAVLVIGFIQDPFGWRKNKIDRLEGQVAAADTQAKVDQSTGAIADRVSTTNLTIKVQAEERASAVEQIPSDDIPPDVRERWLAGLRHDVGSTDAIPDSPAELPGAVQPSEP